MTRFYNDIRHYFKYSMYAARAELKAEVSGSYLNWIWWILEPLCMMLVYSFVFGVIFSASSEFFPAFIFVGLTLWNFFSTNLKNSVKLMKNRKELVSKVYLPKFILVETKMFVNGFKMMMSFGIIVLMMVFFQVPITWNLLLAIPVLFSLWILTFGLMTILIHFGVYVEDLSTVVDIGLRLMFFVTGVMFSIEERIGASHPWLSSLLGTWNPIAFLITSMRDCLLYGRTPNLLLWLMWTVIGIVISAIGVSLIYKFENSYVKVM